jgi:hypothetical protein
LARKHVERLLELGLKGSLLLFEDAAKDLKYPRQSNHNRTIHILHQAFIRLLLEPNVAVRNAMLERVVDAIAQKPVSIVANRSPARSIPRKKRFPVAKKFVV